MRKKVYVQFEDQMYGQAVKSRLALGYEEAVTNLNLIKFAGDELEEAFKERKEKLRKKNE